MELTEVSQIQDVILDILKHIDTFCRRHEIRYFMAGGTMLGAVRHKGFIPWDDDADIVMPRPDYDRFVKEYRQEGHPRYRLLESCYLKVEDSYTMCKDYGLTEELFGINVDIFPLDGAPEGKEEQIALCKEAGHYKRRISHRRKPLYAAFLPHHGAPLAIIQAHFHSMAYWQKKCDSVLRTYSFEDSPFAGVLQGVYGPREVFPASIFRERAEYEFNGVKLFGVKDYDSYLKGLYGNYMQLPPEKDRVPAHHERVTLDIPASDTQR